MQTFNHRKTWRWNIFFIFNLTFIQFLKFLLKWSERVEVAQTEFEFDRLLCNRVGGECGSSPTLVFLPVLI